MTVDGAKLHEVSYCYTHTNYNVIFLMDVLLGAGINLTFLMRLVGCEKDFAHPT